MGEEFIEEVVDRIKRILGEEKEPHIRKVLKAEKKTPEELRRQRRLSEVLSNASSFEACMEVIHEAEEEENWADSEEMAYGIYWDIQEKAYRKALTFSNSVDMCLKIAKSSTHDGTRHEALEQAFGLAKNEGEYAKIFDEAEGDYLVIEDSCIQKIFELISNELTKVPV
jgi:hypothetical protein